MAGKLGFEESDFFFFFCIEGERTVALAMGDRAYRFDRLDLLLKLFRSAAGLLVDFPSVLKRFDVGKLRATGSVM